MAIAITHFSDPGCPWAYSASPALAVLRWRYREQLSWRLVTIGLTEDREQYAARGYTPARVAQGYRRFRHLGMPFARVPRAHVPATAPACRAIVATRLTDPAREHEVFRALQLGWFTTERVLDETADIAVVLGRVAGLDAEAILGALDREDVVAAYEGDRAEARTAAGSPTEFQGKAAATDGPVRYTAPSLVFTDGGRRLEAGGFQPVEAYDVLIANLDPTLARHPAPTSPLAVLEQLGEALTTYELAAVMASGNERPDRDGAEAMLVELAAERRVTRQAVGDDALWQAVGA